MAPVDAPILAVLARSFVLRAGAPSARHSHTHQDRKHEQEGYPYRPGRSTPACRALPGTRSPVPSSRPASVTPLCRTEGMGIGLDDGSTDCEIHSNVCRGIRRLAAKPPASCSTTRRVSYAQCERCGSSSTSESARRRCTGVACRGRKRFVQKPLAASESSEMVPQALGYGSI